MNPETNPEMPDTLPPVQEPSDLATAPKPDKPKSSKKRMSLILGVLLLLAAGGMAAYFLVLKKDKADPTVSSLTPVILTVPEEAGAKFYYTDYPDDDNDIISPNVVKSFDPATGSHETIAELTLDGDRFIDSSDAGTNHTIQVIEEGKKIFYENATLDPDASREGEGEPERISEQISLFENGQETKLIETVLSENESNSKYGGIVDWVAAPDGSVIYYFVVTTDKGDPDLRMYTLADKKDTLIMAGLPSHTTTSTPLTIASDGGLIHYAIGEGYTLTEYKVSNGELTTRAMGESGCQCMLAWPQALSADGKKLLLDEQTSGTVPADFSQYVMDTASSRTEKLAGPMTNISWSAAYWSPDNIHIAHGIYPFDYEPGKQFDYKFELINTGDKSSQTFYDESATERGSSLLGWSAGGRYLAFLEDDRVKFYDFKDGKVLDKTYEADEGFSSSSRAWGWL